MFIAKPQKGSQGKDIMLFNDLRQVPFTLEDSMVAQRYIDNPLLVDGLKFDLRMYVVVTGIKEGQMSAYLADEGLARFCTEKYRKPDKDNRTKSYMHLTNYSLNKHGEKFIGDEGIEDINEINQGSKRTLTSLFK